jgi:hypothetical protein
MLSVKALVDSVVERCIKPRHVSANQYCVRPLTAIEPSQIRHEVL